MKPVHVSVLLLAVSVAAPTMAHPAAKKSVDRWTCKEFLAIDDQRKPEIVYWTTAYGRGGKPESIAVDVDDTDTLTAIIVNECQRAPKASFWQTVRAEWRKLESHTESEMKKTE